jgi:hypothetical protein
MTQGGDLLWTGNKPSVSVKHTDGEERNVSQYVGLLAIGPPDAAANLRKFYSNLILEADFPILNISKLVYVNSEIIYSDEKINSLLIRFLKFRRV